MKKRWYFMLVLIVLVFGGHILFKATKVKNVFDEMYYAETQSIPKQYTSTSYSNLIKSGDIKNLPRNMRNEFPHFKREIYTESSLEDDESVMLVFNEKERVLRMNGLKAYGEERLRFTFVYDLDSSVLRRENVELVSNKYHETDYSTNDPKEIMKFLQENNLTEKDLKDYQNYFLYEKVLSDWFEHNQNSRFSMDDLGDVEIIEVEMYGD